MKIRELFEFNNISYNDVDLERDAQHAHRHYPHAKSKEEALLKLFQRSLNHSKEDDEKLKHQINQLQTKLSVLTTQVKNLSQSTNIQSRDN